MSLNTPEKSEHFPKLNHYKMGSLVYVKDSVLSSEGSLLEERFRLLLTEIVFVLSA